MAHLATSRVNPQNADTVNVMITHQNDAVFGSKVIEAVVLVNRHPAAMVSVIRGNNGEFSFKVKAGNLDQYQVKKAQAICYRMSI